jgi:hypothetical protein
VSEGGDQDGLDIGSAVYRAVRNGQEDIDAAQERIQGGQQVDVLGFKLQSIPC